ncbi:pyruvate ferredoxin oxidoreductase gamma subunit [Candidatus Hakubella thermalkaliphila]|uniref:Pyruvate ferredoxin oxidoreductase gamma subunit n=1 Tax=Candidatus Hakubella thermalkaliphila TaxID=2754717 RepID=A0A6V8NIJ5_9ACTN|nr:2-oxoacid:acceptor oxidoreductase family protein [Candidatus Hakubella thermalkaliphila]GFP20033.1 pyruvate ferredoxin oxidoreductase gamma subunit [Candidatus Hakubella thermalkaliphila]
MNRKLSIRMSGLGGQGVVTAAPILGVATTLEGVVSTVNPFFGAEKRLAPAESYVRISLSQIDERGEVLYPNIIMIFHPHVITLGKCYTMPFFDGLQPEGILIINSEQPLDLSKEDLTKLGQLNARLFYLPATQIATQVAETELSTNIAMLGGLVGVTRLVSVEAIRESLAERFGGRKFLASATTAALDDVLKSKFAQVTQLVDRNMEVVHKASEAVQEYFIKKKEAGSLCMLR